LDSFRIVHILVNNAGLGQYGPIVELKEEVWDFVQGLNLKSQFLCTQAVLDQMIKQRYGKIVNISSICGVHSPLVGGVAYATAKAGVVQLAKITAMEASRYGMNVPYVVSWVRKQKNELKDG
jgi:NAD(P)-dependent dehydrogenase (short-subunit alcohol dehydrogenase family)